MQEGSFILYIGDADIGNSLLGVDLANDNRVDNTTQEIKNSASKLMVNVFAWDS